MFDAQFGASSAVPRTFSPLKPSEMPWALECYSDGRPQTCATGHPSRGRRAKVVLPGRRRGCLEQRRLAPQTRSRVLDPTFILTLIPTQLPGPTVLGAMSLPNPCSLPCPHPGHLAILCSCDNLQPRPEDLPSTQQPK